MLLSNFEKVALETRNADGLQPLTFEDIENIPIPKRSRRPIYDIEKALENDIQRAMSLEAQTAAAAFESQQPTQTTKKGKELKDGGLVAMVVEQQDRTANPEDLQTMYSTQATAPVENFSLVLSSFTDLILCQNSTTKYAPHFGIWLSCSVYHRVPNSSCSLLIRSENEFNLNPLDGFPALLLFNTPVLLFES